MRVLAATLRFILIIFMHVEISVHVEGETSLFAVSDAQSFI